QKGGAPQTVIQGGGGQTAAPAPAAAPSPAAEVQPPAPPAAAPVPVVATTQSGAPAAPERDYKRGELSLGATRIADEVGTGKAYTVGGQFNFNRYLGTRLIGYRLATESAAYNEGAGPFLDQNKAPNLLGGQASLVFTPIHIDLVGHKLLRV